MAFQTTIAAPVSYTGVGLHSGKDVTMKLQPAEADTGIVFTRVDLPGQPQVEAKAENVTSTLRATTIEDNGIKMFTIEHVMSALHGAMWKSALMQRSLRWQMAAAESSSNCCKRQVFVSWIESVRRLL